MKLLAAIRCAVLALCLVSGAGRAATHRPPLDLDGFIDWTGAIPVLHRGDFVDPYFALQALLLAQDNGFDVTDAASRWIAWLIVRQKPDARFERFCRNGAVWLECKPSESDAAVLALWLRLLGNMPASPRKPGTWQASYRKSKAALQSLLDPARGIYLASAARHNAVFIDNVEIWSHLVTPAGAAPGTLPGTLPASGSASGVGAGTLARAIEGAFWDRSRQRFLVSTGPAQEASSEAFYPGHVVQVLPLLWHYPYPEQVQSDRFYRQWMRRYRSEWLRQVKSDFAWGILAVLAFRQGDLESAACWRREARAFRRTSHWTVTDEVAEQILLRNRIEPAKPNTKC